jgi:hypothetical protein
VVFFFTSKSIVSRKISFQRDVIAAGGIPGYRFSPPTNVFTSVENLPSQKCYCPAGPPCAPEGTFNVSLCQYDSPVLLTFPHFYLGEYQHVTRVRFLPAAASESCLQITLVTRLRAIFNRCQLSYLSELLAIFRTSRMIYTSIR